MTAMRIHWLWMFRSPIWEEYLKTIEAFRSSLWKKRDISFRSPYKESTCCVIDDVFYSGFAPKTDTAEWKADKVVPKSPKRALQEAQTCVENRRHRPEIGRRCTEIRRFCPLIREASLKKVQACSKKRQNVRKTLRTVGCWLVRLFESLLIQGGARRAKVRKGSAEPIRIQWLKKNNIHVTIRGFPFLFCTIINRKNSCDS